MATRRFSGMGISQSTPVQNSAEGPVNTSRCAKCAAKEVSLWMASRRLAKSVTSIKCPVDQAVELSPAGTMQLAIADLVGEDKGLGDT
jgi:hypothetical protein